MQGDQENIEFTAVKRENRRLTEEVAQLKLDLHQLEVMLRLQQRQRFSTSSERHVDQLNLFPNLASGDLIAKTSEEDDVDIKGHKRRKKKRPTIPANLPRETVHHDLPESDKVCPQHGTPLEKNGETKTTQVEYVPAKIKVVDHICATYGCPVCNETVKAAEPPPSPIPGSIATPSLLAQIATAKFADGLPLYRQEGILARAGIELTRTTMATWMGRLATMLAPLTNLFNDVLLEGFVIYMDETHLQVLNVPDKAATSKSYLWVRVGGILGQEVVLFHFDPSRSGDIPLNVLEGFKGFVTTDDYSGYNRIEGVDGIRRLQCWMHIRRYFKKATKALGKAGKGGIADQALSRIRKLYMLERECADFPAEDRRRFRLEHEKPLLDAFESWLRTALEDVPPKSATGKAIAHALKTWRYLIVYLEDGRLKMDNGPAENAIRPVAVGRKNWLFSSTVEGAEATATLYSVIETAKVHGLDPYAYLCRVIERLTVAKTIEDVEALLPWNIVKMQAAPSLH